MEDEQQVRQRIRQGLIDGTLSEQKARQLIQAFNARAQQEQGKQEPQILESTPMNVAGDVARSFGGGPAVATGAGLAGLAELATGDAQSAAQEVQDVQRAGEAYTTPRTETGKKIVQTVGDLVDAGVDIARFPISGLAGLADLVVNQDVDSAANAVRESQERGQFNIAADSVLEMTGSPAAATATSMAPDIFGTVVGGAAGRTGAKKVADPAKQTKLIDPNGEALPGFERALKKSGLTYEDVIEDIEGLQPDANPRQAVERLTRQKIERGDTNAGLADKMLDRKGQVVDDPLGLEALKQGVDASDVAAVKSATGGTRAGMKDMLRIQRIISKNSEKAIDMQPTDVVGAAAMKRFNRVRGKMKSDAKVLDDIVRNDLDGVRVNPDRVTDTLRESLSRIEVGIDDSSGTIKPVFEGSDIVKDPSARKAVQDVFDLLSENVDPTARRAHSLKKQLDNLINYNRASSELTPAGEKVLRDVRGALNQSIRQKSNKYGEVNDRLSTALNAMSDFDKAMGPSIDLFAEGADTAVGRNLRGLLSNRQTQTKMMNSVNNLDKAAREIGYKFSDDIGKLTNFGAILQKNFGTTRRTSLAGEVGGEISRGGKAVTQGSAGMIDRAWDYAGEQVDKARNINEQGAFKSLSAILNRRNNSGRGNNTPTKGD